MNEWHSINKVESFECVCTALMSKPMPLLCTVRVLSSCPPPQHFHHSDLLFYREPIKGKDAMLHREFHTTFNYFERRRLHPLIRFFFLSPACLNKRVSVTEPSLFIPLFLSHNPRLLDKARGERVEKFVFYKAKN